MARDRQLPRLGFQEFQRCQAFGCGQLVAVHFEHVRHRIVERVCGYLYVRRQKLSPENITRPGSYFCRTELNRDMFGPKYRDAGWFASR